MKVIQDVEKIVEYLRKKSDWDKLENGKVEQIIEKKATMALFAIQALKIREDILYDKNTRCYKYSPYPTLNEFRKELLDICTDITESEMEKAFLTLGNKKAGVKLIPHALALLNELVKNGAKIDYIPFNSEEYREKLKMAKNTLRNAYSFLIISRLITFNNGSVKVHFEGLKSYEYNFSENFLVKIEPITEEMIVQASPATEKIVVEIEPVTEEMIVQASPATEKIVVEIEPVTEEMISEEDKMAISKMLIEDMSDFKNFLDRNIKLLNSNSQSQYVLELEEQLHDEKIKIYNLTKAFELIESKLNEKNKEIQEFLSEKEKMEQEISSTKDQLDKGSTVVEKYINDNEDLKEEVQRIKQLNSDLQKINRHIYKERDDYFTKVTDRLQIVIAEVSNLVSEYILMPEYKKNASINAKFQNSINDAITSAIKDVSIN